MSKLTCFFLESADCLNSVICGVLWRKHVITALYPLCPLLTIFYADFHEHTLMVLMLTWRDPKMAVAAVPQDDDLSSRESRPEGTSVMMRGNKPEYLKMKETNTINSQRFDLGEFTITAILQQNWRDWSVGRTYAWWNKYKSQYVLLLTRYIRTMATLSMQWASTQHTL